ncbi:MAG: hypothetical protein [Microviridae sp.]|nr:MAG: hypothetical protein [Microviridae sp.]
MARKHSRNIAVQRRDKLIAKRPSRLPSLASLINNPSLRQIGNTGFKPVPLLQLAALTGSDLRRASPYQRVDRSRRLVGGGNAAIKLQPIRRQSSLARAQMYFGVPKSTVVCVRRKMRKEVFHAKSLAGRRGFKKPRYNENSKIFCR